MGPVRQWLNDGGKADTLFNAESQYGQIPCTLLIFSAKAGHAQTVELLLKRGADINLQSSRGSC